MSNLHRKALVITIRKLCKPHEDDDDCNKDPLPPLPPPPHLETHSRSPLKILLICVLAATFSFLCYIILVKTCRAFQTRRRTRINSRNGTETRQDLVHEDHEHEPEFHPVWLINTIGLDQTVIDSIQMFKYRKEEGLVDSDCSVCLGVFEEDESLRILPKCSHVFHVGCIDTWLRSHKNCPLCRAPVVNNNSNENNNASVINQTVEVSTQDEEILYNGQRGENENNRETDMNGVRVQSDLTNHCCRKLEPVRRTVSMGSFRFVDQPLVVTEQ